VQVQAELLRVRSSVGGGGGGRHGQKSCKEN